MCYNVITIISWCWFLRKLSWNVLGQCWGWQTNSVVRSFSSLDFVRIHLLNYCMKREFVFARLFFHRFNIVVASSNKSVCWLLLQPFWLKYYKKSNRSQSNEQKIEFLVVASIAIIPTSLLHFDRRAIHSLYFLRKTAVNFSRFIRWCIADSTQHVLTLTPALNYNVADRRANKIWKTSQHTIIFD